MEWSTRVKSLEDLGIFIENTKIKLIEHKSQDNYRELLENKYGKNNFPLDSKVSLIEDSLHINGSKILNNEERDKLIKHMKIRHSINLSYPSAPEWIKIGISTLYSNQRTEKVDLSINPEEISNYSQLAYIVKILIEENKINSFLK